MEMCRSLSQEQALEWHPRFNHFPPVHLAFLPAAQKAIQLANEGDWHSQIKLPNGRVLAVHEIVEGLHLETFLEGEPD